MSNYSDKSGQNCSNNNDCFPYAWCGNGKCYQTCTNNSQERRNYKCICNEGGSNQNCPQGTSCQGNVCQEISCPGPYKGGIKGPVFFLQPGSAYTNPILNNQKPGSLLSWNVDSQFFNKNNSSNKIAQQIQEFVSEYYNQNPSNKKKHICSLFLSGGGNSRLGKLGYYKDDNKYYYQMSYGNGETTVQNDFPIDNFKNFDNTNPITLKTNADDISQVQEMERLRQQIASNKISIETYNRKIEELKEGIIIKRADAERKERQVETQNRQIYGQSKDLENKINLLQTRKAMLDFAIDRNNFKNKQIYTQISGICAVLIIMILLYVFFNKFYKS